MPNVDLSPTLPPARNQGPRETCLSFAASSVHELTRAEGGAIPDYLSVEALDTGARRHLPAPAIGGVSFDAIRLALEFTGQPHEACWPYGGNPTSPNSKHYRATSEFIDPLDTATIRQLLANGTLVVGGFRLTQSFLNAKGWTLPEVFDPPVVNLHAMAITGYRNPSQQEPGGFILRNSWGQAWGVAGYGYMPFPYFQTSCGVCLKLKRL